MVAAGDGAKPVWVTEFGWSTTTGAYGVTEQAQADFLARAFRKLESYPWVPVALWYSFRNNAGLADAPATWEANTGLVRTDYSAKPALAALRAYAVSAGPAPTPEPTPTATPAPSPSPQPDAAPSVTLQAPAAGTEFGTSLAYRADARDDRGIARVEFLLDGKVVATDTSAPYQQSWRVPKQIAPGAHVAAVRAIDTAGQQAAATAAVTRVSGRKLSGVAARRTDTSLQVWSRPGRALVVRGRVRGASRGRLVVSVRQAGSPKTRATRSLRLRRDGRYRSRLRVRGARGGRFRVVARFRGARGAMPSASASLVRLG